MANEKDIWDFLKSKNITDEGCAAILGNMQAESGVISNKVENLCLQRLREYGRIYTDETYTNAVDNGTINRDEFLNPIVHRQYGYGLCQWTYPSRKGELYDICKRNKVSIGDWKTQCEFLIHELKSASMFKSLWNALISKSSLNDITDKFLTDFERPANAESMKAVRREYAKKWYDKFVNVKPEQKGTIAVFSKREKVVSIAKSLVGLNENDGSFKKIIDGYNTIKPLPRGYKMQYTDPWCATFVSYVAKEADALDIIPADCGCPNMIEGFRRLGEWVEDDSYIPKPGDVIFYDWEDGINYKSSDNVGLSDHVGIVEKTSGSSVTIIEGNRSNAVSRRTIEINGRYIRGYGVPKYKEIGIPSNEKTYRVQAASCKLESEAKHIARALENAGIESYYYFKNGWYLVQAGSFASRTLANNRLAELKDLGIVGMIW